MTETYSEKLRDPRWQKKRLEIMQRDSWECQRCGDAETTLNVHHYCYENGKEPWDYDSSLLVTLCEICHKDETENRPNEEKLLLRALKERGFSYSDVNDLACCFATLDMKYPPHVIMGALSWLMRSKEFWNKMIDDNFKHCNQHV